MDRKNIRYLLFSLASALYVALAFTSADFLMMPFDSLRDVVIVGMQWGVLFLALSFLMLLLASNRWLFALVFPPLVIISSILAYFRLTMNAVLTPMLLDVTFDNDLRTSADMITPVLLLVVLASVIIAILFARFRWKRVETPHATAMFLAGGVLLLGMLQVDAFERPISERIPFNIYYTAEKYFEEKEALIQERADLSRGAVCREDSALVVLVVGESLRPDHLGFNGYERNTTPRLAKEDILSFPFIYTEQTYTMRSIPHLLTRADSTDYERAYREKSFIHIYNSCGYTSWWLANQEPSSTFVSFMHECDTLRSINIEKSAYTYDKWLDEDLLPLFDQTLAAPDARKLIILHTIGSHWWYNAHFTSDFAPFQPVVKSRIISSCTPEEIRNSYDNTIVYTDHFLSQLIQRLKPRNAILIYQSDHGEALGENGVYLHAAETPEAHHAACFLYMSPAYREKHPEAYRAALRNRRNFFRSDHLFHTMLDAGAIETPYFDASLSLLKTGKFSCVPDDTLVCPQRAPRVSPTR